ncbi:MAG: anthranilate synthase component I family protein, partial [Candidatus Omnitrophica bacterium]|nr:anthranilate synthase component I family protein [Candidatus Omnitrophota bacterium]
RWGQVPDLHLGFYRSVVIYDHKTHCYYLAAQDQTGSIFKEMQAFVSPASVVPEEKRCKFQFSRFKAARKRADFEKAVRKAKRYIAAGDIYQANLSQRFHFDYSGSSLALYGALRTINPSPFSVFLKSDSLDIVSSSPERLVSKRGEWCETKPIAGTRPRVRRREQALKRELLNNEKERAEHLMLVDLERNDLGRVCRWPTVKVNEFMSVEKYSHVMHLVSRITGQLKSDQDVWDLIQAMFPGGTITGCPKIRCMEIIDELEPEMRGIYTGSIGYVDFNGDADLNIVIRTLVLKEGCGFYQTGAGIVHDSIPRKEYEETLHKGEALKQALKKAGCRK